VCCFFKGSSTSTHDDSFLKKKKRVTYLGHMLVANVAYKSMCPKTQDAVDSLIDLQSKFNPSNPDFVQAACWADDIKGT